MACLLLTCWIARASGPEPTSPAPSIGLPTKERLISLLGSSDRYSGYEIADWLVTDLFPLEVEPAVRQAMHQVAQEAAAEAVKPVLIELAGVGAERDAARRQRWSFGIAGVGLGLLAGILGGIYLGRVAAK